MPKEICLTRETCKRTRRQELGGSKKGQVGMEIYRIDKLGPNICNMDEGFNMRDFIEEGEMRESEIDRCEFWLTANRIVRESNKLNYEECKIEVNSNWNLSLMEKWLENYEDKEVIEFLKYGWLLNAHNTEINNTVPRNQERSTRAPRRNTKIPEGRNREWFYNWAIQI